MSILISALQNAQNAEGFPVNTVPQQFFSVATPVTETKTMAANILYSAQIPLSMSSFTILIIIAVILLTYCIFRKRRSLTLITIEITNGQDCVEIPMKELCLCPSYWHFRGSQYIDNVDVIGTLIPKVTLQWHEKNLFIDINDNKVKLVEKKYIDWLTAQRIRKIIKTTFCAFISIRHHGYAHDVQFHETKKVSGKNEEGKGTQLYPCLSARI